MNSCVLFQKKSLTINTKYPALRRFGFGSFFGSGLFFLIKYRSSFDFLCDDSIRIFNLYTL